MSGGKKKSGFQITSVTSDYEQQQQQQREGLPSPTPPGGGGSGGDAGKKGPGGSSSPRVARGGPAPGEEGDPGGGGGEEEEEGGGGKRANGGGSVSAGGAPNGPSGPPACSGGGGVVSAVSRFRVVKLDQGSGEPYKRGRWTCRDFYEPEAEPLLAAWAAASAAGRLAAASTASDRERQPHSLDSRLEAAAGLLLAKTPQGPFSPQPQRRGPPLATAAAAPAPHLHQPHHHRLLHLPGGPGAPGYCQARSLGGGGGLPGLLRPPAAPPSPGTLRSPLAAPPDPLRPPGAPQEPPSGGDTPAPPPGLIPTLVVEEPRLHNNKSVAQLIRGEADEPRRKVSSPRQSRSRPSSPAPPLFRDASPNRRTSDPFGAARFSLAQSMFGMGVAPHDSDDDSGTNSSLIAIDNKIEQAMDLVKSHLMFAVREEVEVLREQIKELSERNASLEQENALLRSLASAEQLGRFQAQFHAATKPSSSGGSSSGGDSSSSSTTTTTTTTA